MHTCSAARSADDFAPMRGELSQSQSPDGATSADAQPSPRRTLFRRSAFTLLTVGAVAMLLGVTGGCGRADPVQEALAQASAAAPASLTSASCRECHAEAHAAWSGTDHALANRPINPKADAEMLRLFHAADPAAVAPYLVLGRAPSQQLLLPAPGGRWQPHELAYDPARKEIFNVFGDEGRQPGEWGHWTGRGMNWNSMCAHCHMTGFEKNYDAVADTFTSRWVEHGVGCVQCHGTPPAGHGDPRRKDRSHEVWPLPADRTLAMQTCAPCHARNEALTGQFQPGDRYTDHYRVTLPVDAATFYPDGQQRDEVFNWTSMQLSRMGHAGVTCLDCHDPHTNKPKLPVADNQLCLQCHAPPGRQLPGGAMAIPIDPVAHSGHAAGSAGTSCVACHMPVTNYMQRSPRHDHGWLSPDPLLTRELGIPNACSTCHQTEGLDWNIAQAEKMFGDRVRTRQRERARALNAAQTGAAGALDRLTALHAAEDIPLWRATYLALMAAQPDAVRAREAGLRALKSASPDERAAAVRLLALQPDGAALIRPALGDASRLVRLDAAAALAPTEALPAAVRQEFDAYLALALDQPAGRVRLAFDLAQRGQADEAQRNMELAVQWDTNSGDIWQAKAALLTGLGRLSEAARAYLSAAERDPRNGAALAMRAGLAFAEAGQNAEAEQALRLALQRDPDFHRAAYNLGLLLAGAQRLDEAAVMLATAEKTAPREAEYPYALATVKLRQRDRAGAFAAAQRTLAIDPTHAGARQIVRALTGGQ